MGSPQSAPNQSLLSAQKQPGKSRRDQLPCPFQASQLERLEKLNGANKISVVSSQAEFDDAERRTFAE
jgi:hypothetical protein